MSGRFTFGSRLCIAISLGSALQAQEINFNIEITLACMQGAESQLESHGCLGASAIACTIETDGGDTTVGMGACRFAEYEYWDNRLNDSYSRVMKEAEKADAEMAGIGATVPMQAPALRQMQRAWITYRDAACDYERSLWGGGTGGGPATASCLLNLTAQQTLLIEGGQNE